jgi:signal transduction histidine kinase
MTTTTTTTPTRPAPRSATVGTRRVRGLAVGRAVLATSVLYLAAHALGTDFALTDPGANEAHALILPEIVVFTLVFSLLGWGSLALLERFTRRAKAIWATLSTAVLLLSFVPIAIERATADTKVMLVLIHLAVAAALVPMLRSGRSERA